MGRGKFLRLIFSLMVDDHYGDQIICGLLAVDWKLKRKGLFMLFGVFFITYFN
jgi:hypothetical protein